MWKFIVDVVHDFVSSLQPDVGRGFLHVSNVFLSIFIMEWYFFLAAGFTMKWLGLSLCIVALVVAQDPPANPTTTRTTTTPATTTPAPLCIEATNTANPAHPKPTLSGSFQCTVSTVSTMTLVMCYPNPRDHFVYTTQPMRDSVTL